jgi:hypothetical protein
MSSLERRLENLERLVEAVGPNLCERCPCKGPITITEVEYIDGHEVLLKGTPPPPLCDVCPELENPKGPRITHITVVRNAWSSEEEPRDPDALVWP